MITVTADDVRVLAKSTDDDPVLAVVDGELVVLPREEIVAGDRVVYSKAALHAQYGDQITDPMAAVAAGALTERLAESTEASETSELG